MPKKQAMTKTERKGLIASRMRDPNTTASEFIKLAQMYYPELRGVKKPLRRAKDMPKDEDVNALVRKLEAQERTSLRASAIRKDATRQSLDREQVDWQNYLASGQRGLPATKDALAQADLKQKAEREQAEWQAELNGARVTPIKPDVEG